MNPDSEQRGGAAVRLVVRGAPVACLGIEAARVHRRAAPAIEGAEAELPGIGAAIVDLAVNFRQDSGGHLVAGLQVEACHAARAGEFIVVLEQEDGAIGIAWPFTMRIRHAGGGLVVAGDQVGVGQVDPGQQAFPNERGIPDHAVAVAPHLVAGDARKVGVGQGARVVAWHAPVLVLERVIGGLDAVDLGNEVPSPGAFDEFLALQDAAQQQADHHQDDGQLDEGEALVPVLHGGMGKQFSGPAAGTPIQALVWNGSGKAASTRRLRPACRQIAAECNRDGVQF